MNYYKGTLSYKGTKFSGWQKQKDARTIQGELESVVAKISNVDLEDVQVISSGRTDAGVHALAQVIKITTPLKINPKNFQKAINSLVDNDIRLIDLIECEQNFQPVFDVMEKEYKYFFSTTSNPNPLYNDLLTYVRDDLDLEKMSIAARQFVGENDFVNFYTVGTQVKSTIRKIYKCEVELVTGGILNFPEQTYVMTISGSGFLKQMVRLIMATVWAAGSGKVLLPQIEEYLRGQKADKLAPTAPPQGLYLSKVVYST